MKRGDEVYIEYQHTYYKGGRTKEIRDQTGNQKTSQASTVATLILGFLKFFAVILINNEEAFLNKEGTELQAPRKRGRILGDCFNDINTLELKK